MRLPFGSNLIFLILISCNSHTNEKIEYNFKNYLHEIHNSEILPTDKVTYYVINVNECEDCINLHLSTIESYKFTTPVIIVIVGEVLKLEWQEIVRNLKGRHITVLEDIESKGMVYDFGLQKPILLKFRDSMLFEVVKVKDQDVQTEMLKL